jgi:hypothetical protein
MNIIGLSDRQESKLNSHKVLARTENSSSCHPAMLYCRDVCPPSGMCITTLSCQVLHQQHAKKSGDSIGPTAVLESKMKPLHDGFNLRVMRQVPACVGLIGQYS